MSVHTEQEIISGCRHQNRGIQEYVYKNYYSMFMKLCARYAKDMHDAEQLLQDGFLKIFKNIDSYQGNGSFEGWMRRNHGKYLPGLPEKQAIEGLKAGILSRSDERHTHHFAK